jgi:AbrB family looped-hinge helix DNA binding protein
MPIATLTAKGQVTIPKAIREALGLEAQSQIMVTVEKNSVIMTPVRQNLLGLRGFVTPKERPTDFAHVRSVVQSAVARQVMQEGAHENGRPT